MYPWYTRCVPNAGQIYRHDATDVERDRVRTLARDLEFEVGVLLPPDRGLSPLTCRVSADYCNRLDVLSNRLRLLPGATKRIAVALGVDMLERAVRDGNI